MNHFACNGGCDGGGDGGSVVTVSDFSLNPDAEFLRFRSTIIPRSTVLLCFGCDALFLYVVGVFFIP